MCFGIDLCCQKQILAETDHKHDQRNGFFFGLIDCKKCMCLYKLLVCFIVTICFIYLFVWGGGGGGGAYYF